MLDMLGYIGGIYGILQTFGSILFNFFIKRIFYFSVLSRLYHVEQDFKNLEHSKFNENKMNFENENNAEMKKNILDIDFGHNKSQQNIEESKIINEESKSVVGMMSVLTPQDLDFLENKLNEYPQTNINNGVSASDMNK